VAVLIFLLARRWLAAQGRTGCCAGSRWSLDARRGITYLLARAVTG
jgi:hypothetical protein